MVNHNFPILLFQTLLPFTSIILLWVELIPHRGGKDDIICTFATSKFSEHEEIAVGCCGHPCIGDSVDIHDPR